MRDRFREMLKAALDAQSNEHEQFGTGFLDQINGEQLRLPSAWLCPLDMVAMTGRTEGSLTYEGTLYLLRSALTADNGKERLLTPEEKDRHWDAMQRRALRALMSLVGEEGIAEIDNVKCLPNEGTLTGFNDLSLKVTFEVTMQYCLYEER